MGVMLQAFYWDCPAAEGCEAAWWGFVQDRVGQIASDGFTALWLPPASKAANWRSMGYDPYDYFDLGEFNQKGKTETYFGSRAALQTLVRAAHSSQLQVYADVVLNHNSGADEQEVNELDGKTRWTKFTPMSGKFPRTWRCFHPSTYETMDGWDTFGDMPDLCHRNPGVYTQMLEYARFLFEEIGFDGFRFDFVKGYGPWLVKSIAEYRYQRGGSGPFLKPFCVGECWDSNRAIHDWLYSVNTQMMDNPVSVFDFPLHYNLKKLCDSYAFDLRELTTDTVVANDSARAATFVDNHDTVREGWNSVVNDKLLAYAVILTHEGYPSVFWQDYYNFNLAGRGTANGIAALVAAHNRYAGGGTSVLYSDPDVYIMQRLGYGDQRGLVLVLNNKGDAWYGAGVSTAWANTRLAPVAWWSKNDMQAPEEKYTAGDGRADLWAGPRGYVVYAPQ